MNKLEKQPENIEEKTSRETLVRELKEMLDKAYKAGAIKTHERVLKFTNMIREKYPDYSKYRLWHLLIFSTIGDNTEITRFDFPGNDSIEKFIKSL